MPCAFLFTNMRPMIVASENCAIVCMYECTYRRTSRTRINNPLQMVRNAQRNDIKCFAFIRQKRVMSPVQHLTMPCLLREQEIHKWGKKTEILHASWPAPDDTNGIKKIEKIYKQIQSKSLPPPQHCSHSHSPPLHAYLSVVSRSLSSSLLNSKQYNDKKILEYSVAIFLALNI